MATAGSITNKARWYSPYLGRFLSPDPALLIDGLQTYTYVGNDPVNFTDPDGRAKQLARRGYDAAKPFLEWVPGIGDAIAIKDAWDNSAARERFGSL
jgi:uncharacterized protein RhaS with RHS repeats